MAKELLCKNCGYVGKPPKKVPGYFAIELILWLLFLLPGLCYTLWRLSNKYTACPHCGQKNMIPLDSPVARHILTQAQPRAKKREPQMDLPDRDIDGAYILPET